MEPSIRNYRSANLAEGSARLVSLDDKPTTCTLSYSRIEPGKTSSHHIHPWEHEVYIIQGSGTLFCDGNEYPVRQGDAMFIPGNVDHYTLNNGGEGDIIRIEINPLEAARSGGAQNDGGQGTGQPPVIRNCEDLDAETGSRILNTKDGVPNYVMLYNGPMMPGAVSHPDTGGHSHKWDHVVYVLDGVGTLTCDGTDYTVSEGDAIVVPPNSQHQWKNETGSAMLRVTFNEVGSESHEG